MFKDIPQVIRETFWKHLLLSAAIVGFGIIWSVIAGDRILSLLTGTIALLSAVRLTTGGTGKKFTLPEVNERINELLKHSIQSEGVINLFSDVKTEFSLFDPKFLEEVSKMKERNLAVELLKKLIAEQVSIYRRTNLVKSEKFSEIIQSAMNRCRRIALRKRWSRKLSKFR